MIDIFLLAKLVFMKLHVITIFIFDLFLHKDDNDVYDSENYTVFFNYESFNLGSPKLTRLVHKMSHIKNYESRDSRIMSNP